MEYKVAKELSSTVVPEVESRIQLSGYYNWDFEWDSALELRD